MKLTVKTRNIIIGVFLAIIALFLTGYIWGHKRGVISSKPIVEALSKEIERITVKLNNQTLYVTSVEQEIATIKQAKDAGDITNKELRVLNIKQLNEISRLKLSIDTLVNDISSNGQIVNIVYDTIKVPRPAILLPFSFNKTDMWLNLNGTFSLLGKLDISLKLNVPIDVYTGIDSKTKLPIVKLTSNNPYVNVLSVSSIKLDTPPKPKKIGIGLIVGYGITNSYKMSPVVGVGVSYNIFRL